MKDVFEFPKCPPLIATNVPMYNTHLSKKHCNTMYIRPISSPVKYADSSKHKYNYNVLQCIKVMSKKHNITDIKQGEDLGHHDMKNQQQKQLAQNRNLHL